MNPGLVRPLLLGLAALAALVAALGGSTLLPSVERLTVFLHGLQGFATSHESVSALAFVVAYAVLVGSFLAPACFMLTFAGGLLFGAWGGGLLSIVGATAGATFAFAMVKGTLGPVIAGRIGTRGRALCDRLGGEGVACLIALRLAPFLPFAAVTIAAGAARLRVGDFILGTAVGVAPATLIYANLGETAARAMAAGAAAEAEALLTPGQIALMLGLAALSLGVAVVRRKRATVPVHKQARHD